MTETNEKQSPQPRLFQPLPAIKDKQPMPIEADDVEGFLAVVMEKADVTEAEYEKWVGHAEKAGAPDLILYKRHFLRHLLRKSVSWKETQQGKEKWEEKWKEPLQAWFMPLMRLAVYEPDPSANRWFIEPALWACGSRRVLDVLLTYLEQGTNREKAGAARAFYPAWFLGPRKDREPFQQISDERADLRRRADLLFLKTFVGCEDLDVQRSIIGYLSFKPSSYPEEWRHLIPRAMQLARTHPDEYIRHRFDIGIGGSGNLSERDALVEGTFQE